MTLKNFLWLMAPVVAIAQQYPPPPGQYPPPQQPPQAGQYPPAVPMPPGQIDQLVSKIALYPDQLLSQVLAASTYYEQIPEAAAWADQHAYLQADALARAIQEDQLPWDPSVQALLPFRTVIDMMASDMNWTSGLGQAFLQNRAAVMDAVQRERREAMDYGYLRSNDQLAVSNAGGYVEIAPVNRAFIPVPIYDPGVVFVRPRAGFFVGGAISFGGVSIGAAFAPWGWGYNRFDWGRHAVIVNSHPWERGWENRREYVHPYPNVHRYEPAHRVERHEIRRGR